MNLLWNFFSDYIVHTKDKIVNPDNIIPNLAFLISTLLSAALALSEAVATEEPDEDEARVNVPTSESAENVPVALFNCDDSLAATMPEVNDVLIVKMESPARVTLLSFLRASVAMCKSVKEGVTVAVVLMASSKSNCTGKEDICNGSWEWILETKNYKYGVGWG